MTGTAATNNTQGFDFTSTREAATNTDDYPILAFQNQDSGGSVVDNYRNQNGNVGIVASNGPLNDFIQNHNVGTGDLRAVINAFIASQ